MKTCHKRGECNVTATCGVIYFKSRDGIIPPSPPPSPRLITPNVIISAFTLKVPRGLVWKSPIRGSIKTSYVIQHRGLFH